VLAAFGRRTFRLGPGQVDHPAGVEPLGISPPNVRISLRQSETTTEQR
jgi:hypothetical protein